MMPFTIRRARREDRRHLGILWLRFLRGQAALDARFGVATDALTRWENDFPYWLNDESRCIFVAEEAGEVAGFATAHRWAPPPIYAASEEVYIDEFYVVPEAQGQGIGARLVSAVQQWAATQGADRLRVGVLAANAEGKTFWERQHARPFSITYTIEVDGEAASSGEKRQRRLGF